VSLFKVGADGTVRDAVINQSSGDSKIDAHIVACVSSWTYAPAKQDGTPIEVRWEADFGWLSSIMTINEGPARGHRCGVGWYPEQALRNGVGGKTSLSFTITRDGTVENISVKDSSGNADLDNAAIQCASTWRYKPAVHNGQPVDVPWNADVEWSPGPPVGRPHTCLHRYPKDLAAAGVEGEVRLAFTVTALGTVARVRVAQSSGNIEFDEAAAACASHWLYRPAVRNNQVVPAEWVAKVRFNIVPHPTTYPVEDHPVETVVVVPD
jgi:TonB family protein